MALLTKEQFEAALAGKSVTRRVRKALELVLVHGETWRDAALKSNVHESSIMRAKHRLFKGTVTPVITVPKGAMWIPVSAYTPKYVGEIGSLANVNPDNTANILYRIVEEAKK